jgi:O-antigen/teichoic acid export membrane protein
MALRKEVLPAGKDAGWRIRVIDRVAIPGGAFPVGLGFLVSGITTYLYLILAARRLGPIRYSALSSLWTLIFLVGPAFFAPLEQEVCRAAVARRLAGTGDRPAVVAAAGVGGVMAVVLVGVVIATASPLRHHLFEGQGLLVVGLVLGLTGYYFTHLSWGTLASGNHFRGYGVVLAAEGIVRLTICVGLVAVGSRAVGMYGLAIGVAPFVAAYAGWRSDRVPLMDGARESWVRISRAIAFLLGAAILRQFILMVGPLAVQLLSGSDQKGEAGRFLAALALTRVPLFLFGAVMAALLPRLVELASEGRRQQFAATLRKLSVLVVVAAGASALVLLVAGPRLLQVFFGAAYKLPATDLAVLMVGCGAYMLALAFSIGLVAVGGHQCTTYSWGAGCFTFVAFVALASPLGLVGRVQWGLVVATVVAGTAMAVVLTRRYRKYPWSQLPQLVGPTVA